MILKCIAGMILFITSSIFYLIAFFIKQNLIYLGISTGSILLFFIVFLNFKKELKTHKPPLF